MRNPIHDNNGESIFLVHQKLLICELIVFDHLRSKLIAGSILRISSWMTSLSLRPQKMKEETQDYSGEIGGINKYTFRNIPVYSVDEEKHIPPPEVLVSAPLQSMSSPPQSKPLPPHSSPSFQPSPQPSPVAVLAEDVLQPSSSQEPGPFPIPTDCTQAKDLMGALDAMEEVGPSSLSEMFSNGTSTMDIGVDDIYFDDSDSHDEAKSYL
ncbi:hypothetical protein Fot_11129 [Forsythia ovata]|uniref:Uncharacterized protein n=1 Tax=Forsythia ovata TaxID=205694 RepID=A0ABD1WIU3_9LAMI